MFYPIVIDTSQLSQEFNLNKSQIERLLDNTIKAITYEAYRNWHNEAAKTLKQTRNRYLQNLIVVDEGLAKGAVVLRYDDPLVRMIEEGAPPRDMKEAFEKSDKAKKKKNGGWYLTVPFRFGAPTSLGESEVFSGILPQEVHAKIKSFEANIPIGGGMRTRGLKLDEIPQQFQEKTIRKEIPETPTSRLFREYVSKTSKYEGVVKIKDLSTNQTRGYMSFRRVSDKSDPDSWIHPGIDEGNFFDKGLAKTEQFIPDLVDAQIENFLNSL